jgi:hypothetical protein
MMPVSIICGSGEGSIGDAIWHLIREKGRPYDRTALRNPDGFFESVLRSVLTSTLPPDRLEGNLINILSGNMPGVNWKRVNDLLVQHNASGQVMEAMIKGRKACAIDAAVSDPRALDAIVLGDSDLTAYVNSSEFAEAVRVRQEQLTEVEAVKPKEVKPRPLAPESPGEREISEGFKCSICYSPMSERGHRPFILIPCGHTLCKACATRGELGQKCPNCGQDFYQTVPNFQLETAISIWNDSRERVLSVEFRSRTFQYRVAGSMRLIDFKILVAGDIQVSVENMMLLLNNTELEDDQRTLSNYRIQEGNRLTVKKR